LPGFLRDCGKFSSIEPPKSPKLTVSLGITAVQELAWQAELEIIRTGRHTKVGPGTRIFTEGERIEYMTRVMVRDRFMDALDGKLESSILKDFKHALFEAAYPTPPPDWQYLH
jgi:hypothetical protein